MHGCAPAALAGDEIGNDEEIVVEGEHMPAVLDWRVSVVDTIEIIEGAIGAPAVYRSLSGVRPMERSFWNRLRPIVHNERVVQRRRAEPVAHCGVDCVAAGARVDEERYAVPRERHRERVGVRVTGVVITVRSAVDDEMIAGL